MIKNNTDEKTGIRHNAMLGNNNKNTDEMFMAQAIALARSHLGQTGENPSVGAILVSSQKGRSDIVGRGVTAKGGRPHAEVLALRQAGERARGATLYVTLEPCCHFGKTPPCADALIKAGVARVVVSVRDTDRRVRGGGIDRLRQAGVMVDIGCLAIDSAADLAPHLFQKKFNRPFITAKLAISADGFIGKKGEGQVRISGRESQQNVHDLRSECSAILVGAGTALADNPRLDCRFSSVKLEGDKARSLPVRVVMDTRLRLPIDSFLVKTAQKQPVWVFCGKNAAVEKQERLLQLGCRVFLCGGDANHVSLSESLSLLQDNGIDSIFLEGGAELMQSFWDNSLIDKLVLFKSPLLIGVNGYKKPDFGAMRGYAKLEEKRFGKDIRETWLHIGGDGGLLADIAD